MALSPSRIHEGGETHFPWEREAIDFVLDALPDSDPHQVWPLQELLDPGTGRLYELDLLVLARSALFLIEIKSHPGVLTGDSRDWTFTEPGQRPRYLACPYPATNHKSKVLASLLRYNMKGEQPWVPALIFLSDPKLEISLSGGRPSYVVTRENLRQVLVHGLPNGSDRAQVVNRPMMKELVKTLHKLGLRPSQASRVVGGFRLKELVDEREGYQEHHAVSDTVDGDTARVRSYLVPRATSTERKRQLERAANREAQLLARLGHHPNVLSYRSYHPDAPLGAAVVFEAFEDGQPLNLFLKQEPDLSFDDRLQILQAVVGAVDHCHRAELLHRNLSPASVLVRRRNGRIDVRVHRFHTATQADHTSVGTRHLHQFIEALDQLYMAPEVLRDPRKARIPADVFSIGCLAWFLFTGQDPGSTLAERDRLLLKGCGLHLAPLRPDLAKLDAALAWATHPDELERPDSALEWFETTIVDELTRPEPSTDLTADPYDAEHGALLGHGLVVERVLGSGGSAKVFKVQRDGRDFALKVPHDEGCAQQLIEEGRILQRLRHEHIIALQEVLVLGGRHCLLLDYAGLSDKEKRHSSFADLLRAEGTLSLEKARRYGDDLLSAVQYLEEQGITHRDIKPGNLGFTTQARKTRHLTLYDFSLSSGPLDELRAGTPEWRDPWLRERGQWDSAADRYAAACVLYRMLAGTRPEQAPSGETLIEAERFDSAIRDRLKHFFASCFAHDVAARYPSSETMRGDWVALFTQVPSTQTASADQAAVTELLDNATLKTLVESLPLSARARNALDRTGVITVHDLLLLPRNSLSAIRGVGSKVNREIVELANTLNTRLNAVAAPALLPDYTGPNEAFDELLPAEHVRSLHDAGIQGSRELAQMPAQWALRLLGQDGVERARAALQVLAQSTPMGTLSQWAQALLAPSNKRKTAAEARIRALVSLDPLPGEDDEESPGARTVNQVARAFGVEPPLIHSSLQAMRQRWEDTACLSELTDALDQVLDTLGPVAPMADAAAELVRLHGAGAPEDEAQLRLALGLVRLATETRPAPAFWRRLGPTAWVAAEQAALDVLSELGQEADAIAQLEPLASSETVLARLGAKAADSALAELSPDRLVKLAAQASTLASASARMELYPRGMSAERALKLSLNVLTAADLSPDLVRARVRGRYPDADELPLRPTLDGLLDKHELRFDSQSGAYQRPGLAHATVSATAQPGTRQASALPHQKRMRSPEALEAHAFREALKRGVESGRFRVVQVRADFSDRAAAQLADSLGCEPTSLDHELWRVMQRLARELKIDPELIVQTDREGPTSPGWEPLQKLATRAADEVVERVLSHREEPSLLINPGVLVRFDLSRPLATLAHRAQHEDGAAVVLVVPSNADELALSINHCMPIPTESGGQRLRMPEAWLSNLDRAAQ